MDRNHDSEDNMPIQENQTDADDTPSAAQVLADATGKSIEDFTADRDEYPQIHPDEAPTQDLRGSE